MPSKKPKKKKRNSTASSAAFTPPENDNLTVAFEKHRLIPDAHRGTDQFLDVVTWNIRWFNDQDPVRVKNIVNVLQGLNADVIVLEEIRNASLEVVANALNAAGAGSYVTAYGTTGGDQRVAVMYDLEWIRAKDDIGELFGKNEVIAANGKDAFPRLPLWGYFTGISFDEDQSFDFQLVGVHLKSQMGGGDEQRSAAANRLAMWMTGQAMQTDADVIIMGDWNKEPDQPEWSAIHDLEQQGLAAFQSINNPSAISHLMYKNKNNLGSRLDLSLVSMSATERFAAPPVGPVMFKALEDFLQGNPKAAEIKAYIKTVKQDLSDHLPVVLRFYFDDPNP